MQAKVFQNYHKHSYYTNIMIPDSACSIEDYAIRAKELGHGILSSCEHGWQGNYYETYKIAKKYNLKFIFGTEAYFVLDRKQKDGTNCHICIFAKNEEGRKQINEILSEANVTGFYKVPRIDMSLLLSLSRSDIFITSACVAFFKYGFKVSEDIVCKLKAHFQQNFMLEVQNHIMPRQKEVNIELLRLCDKFHIKLIMGCDSHYIYPKDSKERDNVLAAKKIFYEDENECILDYPNCKTAIERFKKQGVLSDLQIEEAINNTNIFLEFDDIEFDDNIKLPSIYPDLSQENKNEILWNLIWKEWNKIKKNEPQHKWEKYEEEIKTEVERIINTNMADYFLFNNKNVNLGIEKGGVMTPTGRGSGVSNYSNTILGFSKVDRIEAPVKMYPERFLSEIRILQTRSLPDIDFNTGDPEPFMKAQKEILGEHSSYQMIAFGKFKVKSAFKLYARAIYLDFQIANDITKQIEKYEKDLKYTDDEFKNEINLYNYIEEKYVNLVKESEKYQNIISDKKPHPCASLIYQGNIKKDIGIMRIKNKKKDVFVTVIDGATADEFKFLKNDWLKADVVNIIHNVFKKIGTKIFTDKELIKITKDDAKVWDLYANGQTVCLNQVEKESTRNKIMRYQPKNITELTAFIAAIRPSFQSMYQIFERRETFIYGIKTFDELLQTKEMKSSFLLYQEQIMATLNFAGIDNSETYGIIKAIAKKKAKLVKKWKTVFIQGFMQKIMSSENISDIEAARHTDKVWQIIDDSCRYGFNASHAYSVALDSLYSAYLKAHYTIDFYEEVLNYYANKSEKDKIASIKREAETEFNIKITPVKFKDDNRKFKADKEKNMIYESMTSIKHLNQKVAKDLYNLGENEYINFNELLTDIYTKTKIDKTQLEILIKLNYFMDYGDSNYILKIVEVFNLFWQKGTKNFRKQIKKSKAKELKIEEDLLKRFGKESALTYTKLDSKNIINELCDKITFEQTALKQIIKNEIDYLGYIRYKSSNKNDRHKVYVMDIEWGNSEEINPKVFIYSLYSGKIARLKIKRSFCNFHKNEIIHITKLNAKPKYIYLGTNKKGKPEFQKSSTEKDWWIERWKKGE